MYAFSTHQRQVPPYQKCLDILYINFLYIKDILEYCMRTFWLIFLPASKVNV